MPARTLADTAKTLGPLGGEVTVALSRGGVGRGHDRLRRRHPAHHQPAARRRDFPKVRSLFPDQHNAAGPGLGVAALTEVVKRVALVAERTTPVRLSFSEDGLVVEAGGTRGRPGQRGDGARRSPASR